MSDFLEPRSPGGVQQGKADAARGDSPELLERIRRGDADAFEQVAREHAPRLFRLALRLTGRRDAAEDLVQETLVRTLPALRRFKGEARLSTYLVRALTNQWKNRLRSKSRSRLVDWFRGRRGSGDDDEGAEPDPPDSAPSALERLESRELAEEVRRRVEQLEPHRRLALLLREVEEMSYEQIAEMTDVPVGTVRSRIARARGDLRRMMGGRS